MQDGVQEGMCEGVDVQEGVCVSECERVIQMLFSSSYFFFSFFFLFFLYIG